jgi:hypothetical protein
MHLSKLFLVVCLLFAVAQFTRAAGAQIPLGYVQISSSNLQNSTGALEANGTITFAPVNAAGVPISYQVNGNGQAFYTPVSTSIANGAFSLRLADTALTAPANICFSVTAKDNVSGNNLLGPGYTCVQPAGSGTAVTGGNAWCTAASGSSGGTCNFDFYTPNLASLVVVQTGPTGATGAAGPSLVSTSTATAFNGILKGNGSNVAAAVAGTDFVSLATAITVNGVSCFPASSCTVSDASKVPLTGGAMTGTLAVPNLQSYQTSALAPSSQPNIDVSQTGPLLTDYDASEFTGTPLVNTTRYLALTPFTCMAGQTSIAMAGVHLTQTNGAITNPSGNIIMQLYGDGGGVPGGNLSGVNVTYFVPLSYGMLNYSGASSPYTPLWGSNTVLVAPLVEPYAPFAFLPYICTPGQVIWPVLEWYVPGTGPAGDTLQVDSGTQAPTAPGIPAAEYATSSDGANWTVVNGTGIWYQLFPNVQYAERVLDSANEAVAGWSMVQAAIQGVSATNNAVFGHSISSIAIVGDGPIGGGMIGTSRESVGGAFISQNTYALEAETKTYSGLAQSQNNAGQTLQASSMLDGSGQYTHTGALLGLLQGDFDYGAALPGDAIYAQFGSAQSGHAMPIFSYTVGSGNVVSFSSIGAATGYTISGGTITFSVANPNTPSMAGDYFIAAGFPASACGVTVNSSTPYKVTATTSSTISASLLGYSSTTCLSGGTMTFNSPNYYLPGQTFVPSGLSTAAGLAINGNDFTIGTAGFGPGAITAASSTFTHASGSATADTGMVTPDFAYPYTTFHFNPNRASSSTIPGFQINYVQDLTKSSQLSYPKLFDVQVRGADQAWLDGTGTFYAKSGLGVGGTPITSTGAVATTLSTTPGLTIGPIGAPTGLTALVYSAGGSLADSTVFYYTVYATTSYGTTSSSTEMSKTTLISGGVNKMILSWNWLPGAISYAVCGRAVTGGELLIASGLTSNVYTDTGSITPSGNCPSSDTSSGGLKLTALTGTQCLHSVAGVVTGAGSDCASGSATSFSAGNLAPLFTSSVATATSTPALTFSLANAAQNSVLAGPATGGAGAPSYQTAPVISAANMTVLPGEVICRGTSPIDNTGSTSTTQLVKTCLVAGGLMGVNSTLEARGNAVGCSASGSPWSACTAANTGTCNLQMYISASSTGTTNNIAAGAPMAATKLGEWDAFVSNAGSLSSQTIDGRQLTSANTVIFNAATGSINTANNFYVNYWMTNSVSTDQCFLDQYSVRLWP